MNYQTVGFLWGSSRFSGDYLLAQSQRKEMIERVKNDLQIPNKVFRSETPQGKETWRLKIARNHPYVLWMLDHGYVGRNEDAQRDIPTGLNAEERAEFFRGYFSVHHSLDLSKRSSGLYKPRLRFYASETILLRLTSHLNEELGTGVKKPQRHQASEICKILYYQSPEEIEIIYDYLFGGQSKFEAN